MREKNVDEIEPCSAAVLFEQCLQEAKKFYETLCNPTLSMSRII